MVICNLFDFGVRFWEAKRTISCVKDSTVDPTTRMPRTQRILRLEIIRRINLPTGSVAPWVESGHVFLAFAQEGVAKECDDVLEDPDAGKEDGEEEGEGEDGGDE